LLKQILHEVMRVAQSIKVVFPIHPHTKKSLPLKPETLAHANIITIDPLNYTKFVALMLHSKFVMTDSGGIQTETTALDIPCLTIRDKTEWGITVRLGTNVLVGESGERLVEEASFACQSERLHSKPIPLWDGKASERVIEVLG
jgi:UDP-N-acetylglucosamine 2-epimerase (non-hydrolysing)